MRPCGPTSTSHCASAARAPENNLSDDELRSIAKPVCFIWGQDDAYGGPQIGQRATELMPRARLDVMSGNHAPFLDHPERCAALIMDAVAAPQAA